MIKDNLKKAQDRQKNYADKRRRPLEFEVGDHVYLNVTPRLRLGGPFKTHKLSPRYVGPYQIVSRVGEVAYELALQLSVSELHDVFHVSQLRKFVPDAFHPIIPDSVLVEPDLSYDLQSCRILEHASKSLRTKEMPLVKVQSDETRPEEATWELESEMRESYPHLFWSEGKVLLLKTYSKGLKVFGLYSRVRMRLRGIGFAELCERLGQQHILGALWTQFGGNEAYV
ncbi:uncharacterized protein LOC131597450 [Vicia villosa]|uniref:uncharacterized protein LOC131597450 n=1 Tax=Vicia villosa TaxID=3911 RepID=UPI00273CE5B5|nr:uncharacterized protein LOC131597450 [Vicia villosa]